MNGWSKSMQVVMLLILSFSISFASKEDSIPLNSFFGEFYYVSGGSSGGNYLVPLKIVPFSHQKIILGYDTVFLAHSGFDGSINFESNNGIIKLQNIMLNCKQKTYAVEESGGSGYAHKIFLAGDSYSWQDLYNQDSEPHKFKELHIFADDKPIQELFQKACDYIEQF